MGDVISQAMERVQGVMILFSPDEEAKIRSKFASAGDKNKGLHLKGFQPRPNVIFEAGLALGAHSFLKRRGRLDLVLLDDVHELR